MPYQSILEQLVRRVPGAQSALLLDSEGEVVVQAGQRGERQRLIGAYQGIALAAACRAAARHGCGPPAYMFARYEGGQVIVRPLKDGYYMVLALTSEAVHGPGLHHSALTQVRLDREL